jgi:hypothetical protein
MPSLRVLNSTAYDTGDLQRFFAAGLHALGCKKDKIVRVLPTKGDSRGIAYVGGCRYKDGQRGNCEGKSMVFMLPPPSQLTLRRLARLFEHECKHTLGLSHEQMTEAEYWSRGSLPLWARGKKVRWMGNRAAQRSPYRVAPPPARTCPGHRWERLSSESQDHRTIFHWHCPVCGTYAKTSAPPNVGTRAAHLFRPVESRSVPLLQRAWHAIRGAKSPSLDTREGNRLERELSRLPERSPRR